MASAEGQSAAAAARGAADVIDLCDDDSPLQLQPRAVHRAGHTPRALSRLQGRRRGAAAGARQPPGAEDVVLDLTAEDDAVVIPQPSAVSGQLGQGGAGPGPSSALAQEVAAQQADVQRLFAAAVIRREQARVAALAHLSGSKRRRSGSLTWEERAPMQPPPAEGPKCAVCLEAYREPACGPCRRADWLLDSTRMGSGVAGLWGLGAVGHRMQRVRAPPRARM